MLWASLSIAIKLFSHSGSCGDLIYHLPVIEALKGGDLFLYLHPLKQLRWSYEYASTLIPLLEVQNYINSIQWCQDGSIGIDLGQSLRISRERLNLTQIAFQDHGLPPLDLNHPWLRVPEPNCIAEVIINRSPRWRNELFPWGQAMEYYRDYAVFVGHPSE